MPTVSDILAINLLVDTSGVERGEEQTVREVERVKSSLRRHGEELERLARGLGSTVATTLRSVAGLMGVILTFEGFKRAAMEFAESGAALGRFSEAVEVSAAKVTTLEQAIQRAGGRSEDVRPLLARMRSDISSVRTGGPPPEWMMRLGQQPFGMSGLQYRAPDDILLDVARRARGMAPTQLQQYLSGLPLSPETLAILTNPDLLERYIREVEEGRTAVSPNQVDAAERLREKFTTLEQLNDAVLRDLLTLSEPVLTSVLNFLTRALEWLDGIERRLIGEPKVESSGDGMIGSRPGFGGYRPSPGSRGPTGGSATGGPRLGSSGSNYMRGPLPGEGDLVTVQTAAGPMRVNRAAAGDMKGFVDDLVAAGAPVEEIGSYNRRTIAGTGTWSQHAYGTAIDYGQQSRNVTTRRFSEWASSHPSELRAILQKNNMISGGDWRNPDFGHFEWGGPAATAGAGTAVRGSMFDDRSTASGRSAASTPGIALPSGGRMGDWYEVTTPDGRKFRTQLIDRGPAKWTGRGVDISRPLAEQMGYGRDFPTDSQFTVRPLGPSPSSLIRVPDVDTGAGAAATAPRAENRIYSSESSAVVNHVTVNTGATSAAGIARDIRDEVSKQLASPELQKVD